MYCLAPSGPLPLAVPRWHWVCHRPNLYLKGEIHFSPAVWVWDTCHIQVAGQICQLLSCHWNLLTSKCNVTDYMSCRTYEELL